MKPSQEFLLCISACAGVFNFVLILILIVRVENICKNREMETSRLISTTHAKNLENGQTMDWHK